jgi:hypothetical protein
MKVNDPNLFSVENLLEEAQFSPPPDFAENLHARLQQQLSAPRIDPPSQNHAWRGGFWNESIRLTWRWILSGVAVLCMAFVLLVLLVPSVQAQVISLVQHFGVKLPFASEGLVISPFTPLAPEKIPTQMKYFVSYNQEAGGPVYIELRYFSQDTFLVIDEAQAQAGEVLPQGEPIHVGEYDAVMERDLSGMVFLAAHAPQPWRQAGSGGGGGNSDDSAGAPPQQFIYNSATRITWVQAGLHVELLTNLSQDEALRLAASLRPAPQLKKP